MSHAYPSQLAAFVCERWKACGGAREGEGAAELPPLAALGRLLSTAYQATLLKEEERPVTFRLILGEVIDFPESAGPPTGFHRLVFTRARLLDTRELRMLSPAAKFARTLIGVRLDEALGFVIWGILQSGPRWLSDAHGGRRSQNPVLPGALVVRATGPGRLTVARGIETLGELRAGIISRPSMDVFRSKWLVEHFAEARGERTALHDEARARASSPWATLDPDISSTIAHHMFKRIIVTMRRARHGGLLLLLPPAFVDDAAQSELLRAKYTFQDAEPRRRYRTLILRVMSALAEEAGRVLPLPSSVAWSHYEASNSQAIAGLDEAIFELSHLIGALADIDGAVVLTNRFELLGFGAEVTVGDLREVRTVQRAVDLEGHVRESERADSVGTRHRAAYRLCQRVHEALAVVASQDGGIRFVRWMNDAVTYWDHDSVGAPDL